MSQARVQRGKVTDCITHNLSCMQQRIAVGVCIGIFLGLLIDTAQRTMEEPIIYTAHAQEVAPKEVLIEVRINWTKERIEEEIRKTFPEDPERAVAIAKAESGLRIDAVNPEQHKGCKGSIGIMQIACVHNIEDIDALKDPIVNLKKAREIYDREGWQPWGAYTNGSYKLYE